MALIVAETQETLESISMEKCSLRCSKGIRRSEFYPISDTYFSPFLQIRENLAQKGKKFTPCNVECEPCSRYENQKCVGCPTTSNYKGSLQVAIHSMNTTAWVNLILQKSKVQKFSAWLIIQWIICQPTKKNSPQTPKPKTHHSRNSCWLSIQKAVRIRVYANRQAQLKTHNYPLFLHIFQITAQVTRSIKQSYLHFFPNNYY